MKFYDRTEELAELKRIQELSFKDHSRLTVITGRRRIGKTSLVMKSVEDTKTIYLFVGRKNESLLCTEYIPIISKALDTYVPSDIKSFSSLFRYLMEQSKVTPFNLVIDEFQEFYNVNESIYSDMQNIWDQYRLKTKMNLVVSGSIYSLMEKIFRNSKQPLFGRADNIIKLSAFSISTLKEILHDYRPDYTNDDLLALYTFTGGVPKYIELFCDNNKLSTEEMILFMARDNSSFIDEGKNLLIEEFGKNYGTYFSILSAISGGINTQSAIQSAMGEKSVGGYLQRLSEEYDVIKRQKPLLAKEGTKNVRYDITDNFLRFWFNYFDRNKSLVELRNFKALQQIILSDYPTYSGITLERYFKQQMKESFQYKDIGSWWNTKSGDDEIDIVGLRLEKNKALVVEVKRQRKNFKPELLTAKVNHLKSKVLPKYSIDSCCWTLEDM